MLAYALKHWYRRQTWGTQAKRSSLSRLYNQPKLVFKRLCTEQRFLVLDCEMSGLDPKRNELLSIGWVQIKHGRIDYRSRRHLLIHSQDSVGDSFHIHGLCDQRLAGASSISLVLDRLVQQLDDAILVFHHAGLDIAFLQKAARSSFACPMLFPYVDTMQIEQTRIAAANQNLPLNLASCRTRYNLPAAFQHNAMFDAIATAELLLAQFAHMSGKRALSVADLPINLA